MEGQACKAEAVDSNEEVFLDAETETLPPLRGNYYLFQITNFAHLLQEALQPSHHNSRGS